MISQPISSPKYKDTFYHNYFVFHNDSPCTARHYYFKSIKKAIQTFRDSKNECGEYTGIMKRTFRLVYTNDLSIKDSVLHDDGSCSLYLIKVKYNKQRDDSIIGTLEEAIKKATSISRIDNELVKVIKVNSRTLAVFDIPNKKYVYGELDDTRRERAVHVIRESK